MKSYFRALKKYYNIWKHGIEKIEELPIWESDYQLSSQEDLALFWEFQEVGNYKLQIFYIILNVLLYQWLFEALKVVWR